MLLYLLKKHLNDNCMSYKEHLEFSSYLSFLLFKGSAKAIIHSFIPCFYETSTSDLIAYINFLIYSSGCNKYKKE
jgi:predicted choloylglycine hydrolase